MTHRILACCLLATALAAADSTERDPWTWPYDNTSIWNMPIGSDARYVPANLPAAFATGSDDERHIRLTASDPVREIYPPSSWETRWPGDQTFPYRDGVVWRMPVPDALIIPDAAPGETPNECTSFLMPNGREVRQLEPTCRLQAGAHIVGWPQEPQDLYGQGILGSHYGSGLATLGGSIRLGELTSGTPLRHAIKLNIWGKYLYYDRTAQIGYRWPAESHDSYAPVSYLGANPALRMGALLALPPNTTPTGLGLTTVVGRTLFAAMQDYGAYIVDDSGWDAHDLSCERGVIEEVRTRYGLELGSESGALHDDINRLVRALQIVDNNTPTTIGGGGTPRRPLAPPLADPALPVPAGITAAVATGGARVAWNDVAGDNGYQVQRRGAGASWAIVTTPVTNVITWTDSGASAGATWEYRVRSRVGANVSAWSTIAAVTMPVSTNVTITSQPANVTVTAGQTATFTVAASGTATLTYQWSSAPSGSTTFAAINGATSASYTTGATSTAMSGTQYRCVATNSTGSATSSTATLMVTATSTTTAPAITTQPSNAKVTAPATATFTVAASGSPAPTYQWSSAPSGSTTFSAISGATSASYTTSATSMAMTGTQYRCVATNSAGSATSNAATLTLSVWGTTDIGAVAATGSSTFSGGIWTLRGSGADIWGSSDEFRFTSQAVSGDVVITARVTGLQNTNGWAKAGVMVRETLGATSRHAFTCLTASNGPAFQRRLTTAGSSAHTGGPNLSAPGWVRLERVGNVFISSVSSNGATWTEIRRETISMTAAVQVGLAVTSHADGTLCTATLSDVTVVSAPVAVN